MEAFTHNNLQQQHPHNRPSSVQTLLHLWAKVQHHILMLKIQPMVSRVLRDSSAVLLEGHRLPKVNFIHLYYTTPHRIVSGHVAAKLPCNPNNSTDVNILVGQAPNLHAAHTEFISELSVPVALCLYHADLKSNSTNTITGIAIQNNSTNDITFPSTSTVVAVDKIAPLPAGEEGEQGHT
jgi:hypothetical protein